MKFINEPGFNEKQSLKNKESLKCSYKKDPPVAGGS
jgi:hypothetical protein